VYSFGHYINGPEVVPVDELTDLVQIGYFNYYKLPDRFTACCQRLDCFGPMPMR
jgi:hypothetical protein